MSLSETIFRANFETYNIDILKYNTYQRSQLCDLKMWSWDLNWEELNSLESWFYRGPHLFVALYYFYKASFWGAWIHIGPKILVFPNGFVDNFLNLPLHLQDKILEIVWQNDENFNEIVILKRHPQLRVDLRFLFLVYGHHKTKNFPINKFGYGFWNSGERLVLLTDHLTLVQVSKYQIFWTLPLDA